jgi:hypothetical protein
MTRTERILEKTEQTLGSWDDDGTLTPDPYLAARVKALDAERTSSGWRSYGPFFQPRYAAILALLVVNVLTVLYLELSPRHDLSKHLASQLRDDFQMESTPDNP